MRPLRRWAWLGLCAVAVVTGCNIPSLSYFLAGGGESKADAKWHALATANKDEKVRVAILASSNLPIQEQMARVDRELCKNVVSHLSRLCQDNEENVVVLPMTKVEHYKSGHPDWNDGLIDLYRIGKDLKVRYVVYLELNKLTLFEPGTTQLYRGETEIEMTLVDVSKGQEDISDKKGFHERYPSVEIDTFDMPNPNDFRSRFLNHIGERIAWEFTKHPTKLDYARD